MNYQTYNGGIMEFSDMERGLVKRIPGYLEIMDKIADLESQNNSSPRIWLDTGCGNGALVRSLIPRFKGCQFVMADPSEDNISVAKTMMRGEQRCLYVTKPTEQLNFGESTLDVVSAVLSHHYYRSMDERKIALDNCVRMLRRGGLYIVVEHVRSGPDDQALKDEEWRDFMGSQGLPGPFIEDMISRRDREYFPLTESAHVELLKLCGLNNVNIFWRSCSDIGIAAQKP